MEMENVPSEIRCIQLVEEIENFNLWYGENGLFD